MKRLPTLLIALGLATAPLTLPAAQAGAARPAVVDVVAAENFWGNIASQLGGSHVTVTSLITSPNADPHLFESNATDAAAVASARVVIENGVSYDRFMSSLLAADAASIPVVSQRLTFLPSSVVSTKLASRSAFISFAIRSSASSHEMRCH